MTRAVALVVLALVALSGCGGPAAGQGGAERPDGRLVLVSGRDDHGELAQRLVLVYDAQGSSKQVGRIADGTLAHVTEVDGTWLHVVAAEGRPVDGWVDDFFLRGVLHLVGPPPACRAELDGRPAEGGLQVVVAGVRGGEVLVSDASDPTRRGWVPRSAVQELPPEPPHCGGGPDDGGHEH